MFPFVRKLRASYGCPIIATAALLRGIFAVTTNLVRLVCVHIPTKPTRNAWI